MDELALVISGLAAVGAAAAAFYARRSWLEAARSATASETASVAAERSADAATEAVHIEKAPQLQATQVERVDRGLPAQGFQLRNVGRTSYDHVEVWLDFASYHIISKLLGPSQLIASRLPVPDGLAQGQTVYFQRIEPRQGATGTAEVWCSCRRGDEEWKVVVPLQWKEPAHG